MNEKNEVQRREGKKIKGLAGFTSNHPTVCLEYIQSLAIKYFLI
jgi:hypothetical protein